MQRVLLEKEDTDTVSLSGESFFNKTKHRGIELRQTAALQSLLVVYSH